MEFKRNNGMDDCSGCEGGCLRLNEYGMCAVCWAKLSAEARAVIEGPPKIEVIPQTITIHKPIPGVGKFVAWAFFAALAGEVFGSALMHALYHFWPSLPSWFRPGAF